MIVRLDAATRTHASRRRRVRGLVLAAVVGLLVTSTASCTGSSDDGSAPTRTEITAMLARHAAAVRDHDEKAFLAGTAGAYRGRQRQVIANLAELPLSAWSYSIGPRGQDATAQRTARKQYGASAEIVRVTLRYGLRGVDAHPTSHELYWTFARHDGAVVIVDDRGLADVGGVTWRGPWDFGPVTVSRGRAALIIAATSDADLSPTLVADVDRAVPIVTGVVGASTPSTIAVIVPGSAAARTAALASAASDGPEVGAVTTSDGEDPLTGAVLGQRVVVVPDEFRTLTPNGGRVVLQHEITHVATAGQTTSASPTWLIEGFADYVGYLDNARPVRDAAAELVAQIRRAGLPNALPDSSSFASPATNAAAYELSWLACRRIAGQYGQRALLRFYDAVGTATVPADEAVADAARSVLGETSAQLTARTRSYVAEQLG